MYQNKYLSADLRTVQEDILFKNPLFHKIKKTEKKTKGALFEYEIVSMSMQRALEPSTSSLTPGECAPTWLAGNAPRGAAGWELLTRDISASEDRKKGRKEDCCCTQNLLHASVSPNATDAASLSLSASFLKCLWSLRSASILPRTDRPKKLWSSPIHPLLLRTCAKNSRRQTGSSSRIARA